jgi:hypothetical protein
VKLQRILAAGFVAGAALAGATPAFAERPDVGLINVDATGQSGSWTALCGFPVFVHNEGRIRVTLFRDPETGQVTTEVDTTQGFKTTFYSPVEAGGTGASFTVSTASSPQRTIYPDGIYLGAPGVLYAAGGTFAAPGVRTAGLTVIGVEVAFIEDGIPYYDITGPITLDSGRDLDFDTFVAARCGALAGG